MGGARCDARASPTRAIAPLPPPLTPHAAGTGRQPSVASAQLSQHGEGGELRGQGAAQAAALKAPASERSTSGRG